MLRDSDVRRNLREANRLNLLELIDDTDATFHLERSPLNFVASRNASCSEEVRC